MEQLFRVRAGYQAFGEGGPATYISSLKWFIKAVKWPLYAEVDIIM